MANQQDYNSEIRLNHNELPAKVNSETGEITIVPLVHSDRIRHKISSSDLVEFEPGLAFRKDYNLSWKFLDENLNPTEFKAAWKLAIMAKANTNSLEPLSNDTTLKDLAVFLSIGKNQIDKILKRLWSLGVYGKFEVADADKPFKRFWILNPYLSFSGKYIDGSIKTIFDGTKICMYIKEVYKEKENHRISNSSNIASITKKRK